MESSSYSIEPVSWSPRAFIIRNILTPAEAQHIIDIGKNKVSRSLVASDKSSSKSK